MATASDVIALAMRLYGIIDQVEQPTSVDLANLTVVLNNMLRGDHVGGAAQYLMSRVKVTVPAGQSGNVSSFTIGNASASYLLQIDALAIREMWAQDIGPTVNRELTMGSISDVVRTTSPGRITKWHQERQIDGSILVTVWQPPQAATPLLINLAKRIPPITKPDGIDTIPLPPEGIEDVAMLLGRRVFQSYGRKPADVAAVLSDSERVHARWTDWAKGQQWLRMVRS